MYGHKKHRRAPKRRRSLRGLSAAQSAFSQAASYCQRKVGSGHGSSRAQMVGDCMKSELNGLSRRRSHTSHRRGHRR